MRETSNPRQTRAAIARFYVATVVQIKFTAGLGVRLVAPRADGLHDIMNVLQAMRKQKTWSFMNRPNEAAETGINPPSHGAKWLRFACYSRIKGTNRTGAMIVIVVIPSACFANTISC